MILSVIPWLEARPVAMCMLLVTLTLPVWAGCLGEHRCPAGYIKGRSACELVDEKIPLDPGQVGEPDGMSSPGASGAVQRDAGKGLPTDGSGPGVDSQAHGLEPSGCPGPACDFTSLCGGHSFTCGLIASGQAVCWGDNTRGQLGRASASRLFGYVEAKQGVPLAGMSQLACGYGHACAVLDDHTVRCWGAGDHGQLGRRAPGHATYASEQVDIPAAQQVVAGDDASCARLVDGTVTCWGSNAVGQLGRGSLSNEVFGPEVIPGLKGVVALDFRFQTVYAIVDDDRSLKIWGGRSNEPMAIKDGADSGVKGVQMLGAGGAHGCFVVGAQRNVLCTGWDKWGQIGQGAQPCQPGDWCLDARPVRSAEGVDELLSGVDGLAVSAGSACARRAGQLYCWGTNSYGELGIGVLGLTERDETKMRTAAVATLAPEGEDGLLSDVQLFGAGYRHFCAVRRPGELLCWGDGERGQLGIPLRAVARPMAVPLPAGLAPP